MARPALEHEDSHGSSPSNIIPLATPSPQTREAALPNRRPESSMSRTIKSTNNSPDNSGHNAPGPQGGPLRSGGSNAEVGGSSPPRPTASVNANRRNGEPEGCDDAVQALNPLEKPLDFD